MHFDKLLRPPLGADHGQEHIDPGIRMGASHVILSEAKDLAADRDRPFASLSVTMEGPVYRAHRRLCGLTK